MSEALVDFEPLQERMGEYRLPNGIRLRVRVLATYIWEKQGSPRKEELRSNTILSVWAPQHLKGKPSAEPLGLDASFVSSWEADEIDVVRHPLSVYEVGGDHLLRIGFAPKRIRMSDKFDKDGEPVLNVDYETMTLPVSIRELPAKTRKERVQPPRHSARRARR